MSESGLTVEKVLNGDTFMALESLNSTRQYNRIVQELSNEDIRLEQAPFGDGKGEVAARAVHTLDVLIKQSDKRWKFFKRLVGIHRYLISLYLMTLLVVSIVIAMKSQYQPFLSSSIAWWLVFGNIIGLISLGTIVQVDKNTLSESDNVDRLKQKRIELMKALKALQSPELKGHDASSYLPIRDKTGQMIIIRHHLSRVDNDAGAEIALG